MHEGEGICLKYLKKGWNRKEGRGHKDFKKDGQARSRVGCLKKGGMEPLYKLWATSGYIEGHVGRIPKQLTVFLPNDVSHGKIFGNVKS